MNANTLAKLSDAVSLASSSRVWLSGGTSFEEPLRLECVLETVQELRAATHARIDVAPPILDRLVGNQRPAKPSEMWLRSRAALVEVWRSALREKPKAIGLSLSHSKGSWLAASRAVFNLAERELASVGVDLERADRSISDRLLHRFQNEKDEWTGVSRIGLWTAKEALYKADLDSKNKTLVDYAVRLWEEQGVFEGVGASPDGKIYAACLLGIGVNFLGVAAEISRPMR